MAEDFQKNKPTSSDISEFIKTISDLKLKTTEKKNHPNDFYNFSFKNNTSKPETINEKIRKQKIENDNKEKDQNLKKITLIVLFIFLALETATIFTLAFFQGFHTKAFDLDTWSFRIIVVATLGQITAMLTIAVRHLFPHHNE